MKIALIAGSDQPTPEQIEALEAEGYQIIGTIREGEIPRVDTTEAKQAKAFRSIAAAYSTVYDYNLEIESAMSILEENNNRRFFPIEIPQYKPEKNFPPKGKAPIPQKYKRNRFSR